MGPTPAKVGMIMTGIHRQPVLIPDPLCSIARHNDVVQVAMDLGSVISSMIKGRASKSRSIAFLCTLAIMGNLATEPLQSH